jgi:hypothetical protein
MLKKLMVAVFLVLILGGSTIAFAWWDNLSESRLEANIVTLGEGATMTTSPVVIDPATDGYLIPSSAILKPGDTHEILLNYNVNIDQPIASALNLLVTVTDINVGSTPNPFDLISVNVTNPGTILNDPVNVILSVTIDDSSLLPSEYEAARLALMNNQISFNIHFQVTA